VNYLIAPDSFKGSLSSQQAAEAIREGILKTSPSAAVRMLPMADGGEGTLDIMEAALQGKNVRRRSCIITLADCVQPYDITSYYITYKNTDGHLVACIESAAWIGLDLPGMRSIDVMRRGSAALGQCILHARNQGIRHFMIGLGGTASNDGGLGMLMQLGLRALDQHGKPVTPDMAGMQCVHHIEVDGLLTNSSGLDITVLIDVQSPLTGAHGATQMFGGQKGIMPEQFECVDRAMGVFADQCEQASGRKLRHLPGSGAAGGLGFAFTMLGARLVSGASFVMELLDMQQAMAWADWVVTGEGRSDVQTLQGKLPCQLAKAARKAGKKVALISGMIDDEVELIGCFDLLIPASGQGTAVDIAMSQAYARLSAAASRLSQQVG